ncbi:hypothetical protein V6N13_023815 [Hibiscus sabdariffa]|uniref:Uncharacterized protein n=1 Tax=Hibiscus sabdariffa TaxID=183260 RepID=A0ABR2PMW4_9ROSI
MGGVTRNDLLVPVIWEEINTTCKHDAERDLEINRKGAKRNKSCNRVAWAAMAGVQQLGETNYDGTVLLKMEMYS